MHPIAQKLTDELLRQRDNWACWIPVALAAGVGLYFSLHAEPPLWAGPAGLVLVALLLAPFYRNRKAVLLTLPLLLAALGFTAAQWRAYQVATPMIEKKTYPLFVEARVAAVEALPQEGHRLLLESPRFQDEKYPEKSLGPMPRKVRIKIKKGDTPPQPGDTVRVRAILLPVSPPVLPGSYDFQRHMFFHSIGATGFALAPVEVLKREEGGYFFANLRKVIGERFRAAIPHADAAAITTALLDGEDENISKETYETIRKAGLAHLIAISGLQITLVTGFFFLVVRAGLASVPYIALRWPVKKITAFMAALGAVFYMALIGDAISAERSVIMVCVVMGAIMLDRDPFTLRTAAFAAAVLLLFQPESLFSPGFQLSFAAVVALIAFYEATRAWWMQGYKERRWYERFGLYVLGSMATTLVATLATAPIALYHFLSTPLFPGLVANLVAVPLSSFITLPAAILGALLIPFGLESFPLAAAAWSVRAILAVAEEVAGWPYGLYHTDAWPLWILVTMALGGIWLCLWRGAWRALGLAPFVLAAILIPLQPRADVLASGDAKLFAVRAEDGVLWVSSARANKFGRKIWEEREGGQGVDYWPKDAADKKDGAPITCDPAACLYRKNGFTVSFIKNREAVVEDCAAADVVIGYPFISRAACSQPSLLLDGRALREDGAYALRLTPRGIVARSVRGTRGLRPWTRGGEDDE